MLDYAKLIHEAIGIESPRTFIAVFGLFGLLVFAGVGWLIDKGYRVKLREPQAVATKSEPTASATSVPTQTEPLLPVPIKSSLSSGPASPATKSEKSSVKNKPDGEQLSNQLTFQQTNQPGSIGVQGIGNQVTINPGPKPLLLTDVQYAAVRSAVGGYAGRKVQMVIDRPTEETSLFARNLKAALAEAGVNVETMSVSTAFGPPSNCYAQPGVWFIIGSNRMDEATTLGMTLGKSGVVGGKVYGCTAQHPDDFTIVISRT